MKRDDFSFLKLFEDPLMTIIAIVLFSTVWMILPKETKPVDAKVYLTLDELETLKREIDSLDKTIKKLKMEIKRRNEEIKWIESRIEETVNEKIKDVQGKNTEQLKNEAAATIDRIKKEKEELNRLEEELEKAKMKLAQIKGKDNSELIIETIRMKKEIEKIKEDIGLLEERIRLALKDLKKEKDNKNTQENLIAQLQNELKTKQTEVGQLEEQVKGIGTGGGFKPIVKSEKNPFFIELVNNHLFPVDDVHYEAEYGYIKIKDGRTVQASKKIRKSSSGEHISKIENSESNFNNILKKLDVSKERIIFLVHNNSFEIFRKARAIALKKGIETGWWTREGDSIIITYGGGGTDIGSYKE